VTDSDQASLTAAVHKDGVLDRVLVRVAVVGVESEAVQGTLLPRRDTRRHAVRLEHDHAVVTHVRRPAAQVTDQVPLHLARGEHPAPRPHIGTAGLSRRRDAGVVPFVAAIVVQEGADVQSVLHR
jgi:hypothetical protein